jgi:D-proline reductase (dithiol) PrdB
VSLAARHLEANGIPTVVFGCARDIVEHCGVPRFVFSDFPLGNPTGRPFDPAMQKAVVGLGLDLLAAATRPGTTVVTPYVWSADGSWKDRVFTKAQPFLTEDATDKWLKRKQTYRDLKSSGAV